MLHFIKRLFKKKQPRLYPVPGEKKRRIEYKRETPIELVLAIFAAICLGIAMQSCSHTAQLPNGCVYKINPPKFKK